jgi:N-acetylglucosaminyldiphosphoundecaprenol N-acetyl-beta-D-mannosaminyltransferase
MPERASFLGVDVALTHKTELLADIDCATHLQPVRVATLNPEFLLEAQHNPAFRTALNAMTHCTVDGSGLYGFLKLFRRRLNLKHIELYHGADLAEDLFCHYYNGAKSFYLLGGPECLAEDATAALRTRYPDIKIVGAEDGGMIDLNHPVEEALLERVNKAKPDILLVGFGAPKQERWITEAGEKLAVPTAIGVGGTFGFYTDKRRAPNLVRSLHFEWLWRVCTERGHAKRAFRAVVIFPLTALSWALKR